MLQPDGSINLPDVDPRITEMHTRNETRYADLGRTIKHVQDKQREVCRLAATGIPLTDVATMTGYGVASVSRIVNNEATADYVLALRLEGDQQVMEAKRVLAEEAIAIAKMLTDAAKDETIAWRDRRHMIDSVLDRAGVSRQSETKNTSFEHKHIGIEHIRKLAEGTAGNVNVQRAIEAHFTPVAEQPSEPLPTADDQLEIDFTASPERFNDPLLDAVFGTPDTEES